MRTGDVLLLALIGAGVIWIMSRPATPYLHQPPAPPMPEPPPVPGGYLRSPPTTLQHGGRLLIQPACPPGQQMQYSIVGAPMGCGYGYLVS